MVDGDRLVPLDALRGIAASAVVTQHVLLAFSPATSGLLAQHRTDDSVVGSSWFVVMNGPAAITLFFVLSGFVLCWGFFTQGDPNRIARSFVKRLPRLAGLVILTTIGSYLLFRFGLYRFAEAAPASKSVWLQTFGFSGWTTGFQPDFETALLEGVATFFAPVYTYNGVLWTMNHELLGSFLVLALAVFLHVAMGYRRATLSSGIILVAVLGYASFLFPFVAGALLAFVMARYRPRLPILLALPMLGVGVYCLGYLLAQGSYAWVGRLPVPVPMQAYAPTVFHTCGAVLVIVAVLANGALYRRLDGAAWHAFGRISFPLYLVHPLVIFSASSALFLDLTARGNDPRVVLMAMFAATFGLSVVVSIPLAWMDVRWNAWLDETARDLLPDPVAGPGPSSSVGQPQLQPGRRETAPAAHNVIDLRPPPLARPMAPSIPAASVGRSASGKRDGS